MRQNLSVYLERVKLGEVLEVTEHGHPVAIIQPLPRTEGVLQRMIAEGRARPALRSHHALPALLRPPRGAPNSGDVIDALRSEGL